MNIRAILVSNKVESNNDQKIANKHARDTLDKFDASISELETLLRKKPMEENKKEFQGESDLTDNTRLAVG
jgi:hypothetical protein